MATGDEEVIECGLVLRSIGYRGTPLPGIPFDAERGLIRNEGGRVRSEADGVACPGEYVVGWIKRGPSGVIGTNKKDANDTVARIVEDEQAGRLGVPDPIAGDGRRGPAVDRSARARPRHAGRGGRRSTCANPSSASRWADRGSSSCASTT